jgi:hypothetical protein
VLAQRAVADSPRWTRAVEDQSAPIPEEITNELGSISCRDEGSDARSREPPIFLQQRVNCNGVRKEDEPGAETVEGSAR